MNAIRPSLGPTHHALLMAWIAREAIQTFGELPADDLLREAIRRYGQQRGRRMAQRASARGLPLDWVSYLAYREWIAPESPHTSEIVALVPQLHMQIARCPWNDAWQAEGLARYGHRYCRDIDRAIVQGFSPALELSVSRLLPAGDPCCEFVYIGFGMGSEEEARLACLQAELGDSATLPWSYHVGHLYWTTQNVLAEHTGAAGVAIAQRALATLEERFGAELAQIVKDQASVDYATVPDAPSNGV